MVSLAGQPLVAPPPCPNSLSQTTRTYHEQSNPEDQDELEADYARGKFTAPDSVNAV
jgi:hypothetical protein